MTGPAERHCPSFEVDPRGEQTHIQSSVTEVLQKERVELTHDVTWAMMLERQISNFAADARGKQRGAEPVPHHIADRDTARLLVGKEHLTVITADAIDRHSGNQYECVDAAQA
jgi:hypothetical protein